MTTVLLIRHGRTKANAKGILAGWSPGVDLDSAGISQAKDLAKRLAHIPISKFVSSPLPRCLQTAEILASVQHRQATLETDLRLAECRYGDWTGKKLRDLAKDPLWRLVQETPSAVHFPGPDSESLLGVYHRANEAVAFWVSGTKAEAVRVNEVIALISHGDVIKTVLASALGMHLDLFQRIVVDPCSVSVVRYTSTRPYVLGMNLVDTNFDFLSAAKIKRKSAGHSDAAVGGGKGVRR